jgi:Kef-type K+ transport system membrane component KefB
MYDAGLALDLAKLRGNTRRVTTRLITVGVVLTWLVAAALAGLLFGLSVQAALMEVRARSLTGWFPGSAGGLRAGRCPRHLAGCLVAS